MATLTVQGIFGANVVENATFIQIQKADLQTNTGYTPAAANDAQGTLAAILIQALALGLDTNHRDGNSTLNITANPDQQLAITQASTSTYPSRLNDAGVYVTYQRDNLSVDLDHLYSQAALDPNNY